MRPDPPGQGDMKGGPREREPNPRGYQGVGLGALLNAGVSLLPEGTRPILGEVTLRGLPFAIGQDPELCYLALGEGLAQLASIPIAGPARTLVFAHRLLESPIMAGGPVGIPVAELRFSYEDGSTHDVVIRDRFEIAALPLTWGQLPFRAVPDTYDRLRERYQGPYEGTGWHQTGVMQASPRDYWLWAWINPHPERSLRAVEVAAHGPRFVIAGISRGHMQEHPLALPGTRVVRIEIDQGLFAARVPIEIGVDVDRGESTYAYTLSGQTVHDFLTDPLKGFGEPQNPRATPAYVNVAALPSATLTLKQGDETLSSMRWADVLTGEEQVAGPSRIRLIDPGRNWVRTKIIDRDTGESRPCRVHFRSPDGVPYAPYGHHPHVGGDLGTWHIDVGGDVRLGQITYAYIDGTCEGWLPRGEALVDVACGFEYEPLRTRVRIEPGQQELTLSLKRLSDLKTQRWFSGDTHVHFLSTQGAHFEARGEDLNVVNLLLSQWGHLFTNAEEFTGEASVSRDGQTIVYAAQENRQHILGHLTLLGLKHPVMPWCSDGPDEAEMGGTLEVTLSEWADRCHEQGGTVLLPHMPNPNGEPAAMIATGRVDAVEFMQGDRYNHAEYYRYLNGGYRLPLVGGTDKMSADVPVGLYRTYVNIPPDEEFTYASWCRNLARGRTFLSAGPLLSFTVEGAIPGDTVHVGASGTVEVEAEVVSIFPVHTLEIVQNGQVVASSDDPKGSRRLRIRTSLRIDGDSWLAARAGGPSYFELIQHRDGERSGVMAHTSPVYVRCGEHYKAFSEATVQYMLTLIDGSLTYIQELSPQHADDRVTHHHGQHDHIAHLSLPFLQARDALLRRIHEEGGRHD
jgi:hypothetical protein